MLKIESLDFLKKVLSPGTELGSPGLNERRLHVISARLVVYEKGGHFFSAEVIASFHDGYGTRNISRLPVPMNIFREALGAKIIIPVLPLAALLPPSWDVPRVEYELDLRL